MAAGLRIAHQVHPVARPTLAEVGGGEQLINGVFAVGWTSLAVQGLLILGPRREPGHCEAGSSQPDRIADGFRRPQPAFFERL